MHLAGRGQRPEASPALSRGSRHGSPGPQRSPLPEGAEKPPWSLPCRDQWRRRRCRARRAESSRSWLLLQQERPRVSQAPPALPPLSDHTAPGPGLGRRVWRWGVGGYLRFLSCASSSSALLILLAHSRQVVLPKVVSPRLVSPRVVSPRVDSPNAARLDSLCEDDFRVTDLCKDDWAEARLGAGEKHKRVVTNSITLSIPPASPRNVRAPTPVGTPVCTHLPARACTRSTPCVTSSRSARVHPQGRPLSPDSAPCHPCQPSGASRCPPGPSGLRPQ